MRGTCDYCILTIRCSNSEFKERCFIRSPLKVWMHIERKKPQVLCYAVMVRKYLPGSLMDHITKIGLEAKD